MTAPQNPVTDGLQQVIAAHHAAVYGYPVIGVHLDAEAGRARRREAEHRAARDAVAAQLTALGATPAAAAAGYVAPSPLTDPPAAASWAVRLEERTAQAYRYLLLCGVRAAAGTPLRRQAVAGLISAADAATTWRTLVSPETPTVPFPGSP